MSEKLLKRSEVRERLNVSRYGYFQLIEQGILAEPIRFSKNSHPFHTESQISAAERRLREMSQPKLTRTSKRFSAADYELLRNTGNGRKQTNPIQRTGSSISDKLYREIQESIKK